MPVTAVFRLEKVAEATFPTRWGEFRIYGFAGHYPDRIEEAVVLKMGDVNHGPAPLVRIHSQCLTGDVFHSLRCDCRAQLELSLGRIAEEGRGLLVYDPWPPNVGVITRWENFDTTTYRFAFTTALKHV
jgi:GTP cyclohydrolase II